MAGNGEGNHSVTQPSGEPLRVVVADDHRFTAHSIGDALERRGYVVLARVHTAGDAVKTTLELQPDVLVIDLDLGPGPTGIDVAVVVRSRLKKIGVVLLTGYEDPRLLSTGLPELPPACVYLVKQKLEDTKEVADAVAHAKTLITVGQSLGRPTPRVTLTDAQIDILRMVASGLNNQAIATSLSMTLAGVEKAIHRLVKKLDIDSTGDTNTRVELTHRYLDMVGYVRD